MLADDDLLQVFLEESREHLDGIQGDLLQLEQQQSEQGSVESGLIDAVFRAIHSIKGGAGFLAFPSLQSLSHQVENVLGRIRDGELGASPEAISVLLHGVDLLEALLDAGGHDEDLVIDECIAQLAVFLDQDDDHVVAVRVVGSGGYELPLDDKAARIFEERPVEHQHLYRLVYTTRELDDAGTNVIEVLDTIAAFGTVVDSRLIAPDQLLTAQPLDTTVQMSIVYASLFDESLVKDCSAPPPSFIDLLTATTKSSAPVPPPAVAASPVAAPSPAAALSPAAASSPATSKATPAAQTTPDSQPKPKPKPKESVPAKPEAPSAIRVATTLLDRLINLAGELVLVRNSQVRAVNDGAVGPELVKQLDQVTGELQDVALALRMQPIATILTKVPRMVRDLSGKLGKQIEAVISGQDTEVDRSVLEQLADPLTHFIRNACDHGLEDPETRSAAGKDPTGRLTIDARHEEGQVVIRISDDGKGMDPVALQQAAVAKGVLDEEQAAQLSDAESFRLIMAAGFSTAETLSDVSGRGVGMDVVRQSIETIGGTIAIESAVGRGSTFTLRLPLTLAIMPALIIEQGDERYAIPQVNLEELVQIGADDDQQIESVDEQPVYRLRGQLLPLVHLSRLFSQSSSTGGPMTLAVVKVRGERFGLVIDAIIGSEEVVIKPLHTCLPELPIFSGSTILGDGCVALILDIDAIHQLARPSISNTLAEVNDDDSAIQREELAHLLFLAGGTEQLSLPLPLISRVVRAESAAIEIVGGNEFIRIDDNLVRLLRPARHLPLTAVGADPDEIFVILPRHLRKPIGLLATGIRDSDIMPPETQTDVLTIEGVTATAVFSGATTLMLDFYRLVELEEPEWFAERPDDAKVDESRLQSLRVLVAEDTPFFQRLVSGYLVGQVASVTVVGDGAEALRQLRAGSFDLLISDIEMPHMNGVELARAIKADVNLPRIPMLALSSRNTEEQVAEALAAGFDAYETKIDRERLLVALSAILDRTVS